MRITMMATENSIQFNLQPESDHERKFMEGLSDYKGDVSIHKGVSIHECMGGYIRNWGEKEHIVAITISKEKENVQAHS